MRAFQSLTDYCVLNRIVFLKSVRGICSFWLWDNPLCASLSSPVLPRPPSLRGGLWVKHVSHFLSCASFTSRLPVPVWLKRIWYYIVSSCSPLILTALIHSSHSRCPGSSSLTIITTVICSNDQLSSLCFRLISTSRTSFLSWYWSPRAEYNDRQERLIRKGYALITGSTVHPNHNKPRHLWIPDSDWSDYTAANHRFMLMHSFEYVLL